jgi:hypothetical protein
MTTACIVVIASSRPDVAFADWVRGTPAVASRSTIQQGEYGRVTRIGRLDDPTLIESSGLVASRSTPGILWSHNDSGTPADLYCMGLDGASCGRWAVAGAANRDWEDIAAGPGPDPRVDFLYIGDIGDNVHAFSSITVYRIPEPAISGVKVDPITARAEALVLKYPDGPHDAEALLVHPVTGAIYVITKGADTGVYKASASSTGSAPTILEKIAHLSLFANFADVTGGDISPDGSRVALATYGGWYELALSPRSRDFDSIWTTTPTRIGQRVGRQWESIAYSSDGASVFMTSEGLHSAMFGASR